MMVMATSTIVKDQLTYLAQEIKSNSVEIISKLGTVVYDDGW
jgi:hypothetical protein